VLSLIAVLILAGAGFIGYKYWRSSTTPSANPSASPTFSSTTVSKYGVTVTMGSVWTVVPTNKAAADAFFAKFKMTHPNYVPDFKTSQLTQLTTFAVEPQGFGVRSVTFTSPSNGTDSPASLVKQAPATVKGLHGKGLSTKVTTFNKYPSLLMTFHVPKSTHEKADSFWAMALVHGVKKSAIITVISANPATAHDQIMQIAATVQLG
jgi:hypothetical protein